ncbi:MAG: hypothetical protein AAF602_14210 [Myxococcota bacterium]
MGRLPPPAVQQWVLDELAYLIAKVGPEPFTSSRLWFPREGDFPDPWDADVPSLERLLKRLLGYVGLPDVRVTVAPFRGDSTVDHVSPEGEAQYRHHGAAAWFGGMNGKLAYFGCAERQLAQAGESLVGVLAHEVAHAWRHVHGLVRDDRDEEECLTDLSTIYLGFGIFTVNNTHRYRTGTLEKGARLYSQSTHSRAGYLSPEAMSFAFAANLLARRQTCLQTWRTMRWLEPNQRGYTRAALRHLAPADKLWQRIGPHEPPHVDLSGMMAQGRQEIEE